MSTWVYLGSILLAIIIFAGVAWLILKKKLLKDNEAWGGLIVISVSILYGCLIILNASLVYWWNVPILGLLILWLIVFAIGSISIKILSKNASTIENSKSAISQKIYKYAIPLQFSTYSITIVAFLNVILLLIVKIISIF